jgi:hypothetical protein
VKNFVVLYFYQNLLHYNEFINLNAEVIEVSNYKLCSYSNNFLLNSTPKGV